MLKSLAPIEPELVRLCRAKTWVAVTQRCETHPDEAKPTTLAMQGASTTALAISVRSGAPIGAIQALIRANASQLSVIHKFSGSILHEALKHRASYDVLRSLLQAVFQYEQVSLLGRQDQQKRNVLHSMVVRVMKELEENGDYDGMWIIFRDMVLAYPEAVRVMDADGNTPLVLALLIPGVNTSVHSKKEDLCVSYGAAHGHHLSICSYHCTKNVTSSLEALWQHECFEFTAHYRRRCPKLAHVCNSATEDGSPQSDYCLMLIIR